MAVFKTNFLAGILVGVALAIATPLAGTELVATLSAPAQANANNVSTPVPALKASQTVNRTGKTDRLHPAHNAVGNSPAKLPKIPEGCDPAFSPLSKGASSNFSSRCLA